MSVLYVGHQSIEFARDPGARLQLWILHDLADSAATFVHARHQLVGARGHRLQAVQLPAHLRHHPGDVLRLGDAQFGARLDVLRTPPAANPDELVSQEVVGSQAHHRIHRDLPQVALSHFQIEFDFPIWVARVGELLGVQVADRDAVEPHLRAVHQARGVIQEGVERYVTRREIFGAEQKKTRYGQEDASAHNRDRHLPLRGPHASRLRPTPIIPPDQAYQHQRHGDGYTGDVPAIAGQEPAGILAQAYPEIRFAVITNHARQQDHAQKPAHGRMHRAGRNHEDLQRQRHERSHRWDEDREQSVALEPEPEFLPLAIERFLAREPPDAVARTEEEKQVAQDRAHDGGGGCLLYTSPSPRDRQKA